MNLPEGDVWDYKDTYRATWIGKVKGEEGPPVLDPVREGEDLLELDDPLFPEVPPPNMDSDMDLARRQIPALPASQEGANFIHVITHECLEGDALRCVIKAVRDDVPLQLDDYVRAGDLLAYFQAGASLPPSSPAPQPDSQPDAQIPVFEIPPPSPSTSYITHYNTDKPCPWCEVTTRTFVSPVVAPTEANDVITVTATPDSGPPFTTTIVLPPSNPTPAWPQFPQAPPPLPPSTPESPSVITITATPAGGETTITTTYTLPPTPAPNPIQPFPVLSASPADTTITSKTTLGSTVLPIETTISVLPSSSIVVTIDSVTVPIVSYTTATLPISNAAGQTPAPPDTATSATLIPPTSTVRIPEGGWPFQWNTQAPPPIQAPPATSPFFQGPFAGGTMVSSSPATDFPLASQFFGGPFAGGVAVPSPTVYPNPIPYPDPDAFPDPFKVPFPYVQGPIPVPVLGQPVDGDMTTTTTTFGLPFFEGPFAGGVVPPSSSSTAPTPIPTEIVLNGPSGVPYPYPYPFPLPPLNPNPSQPLATDAVARLVFTTNNGGRPARVPDMVFPPGSKEKRHIDEKPDAEKTDAEKADVELELEKRRTPDHAVRPAAARLLDHISLAPGQTLNPNAKLLQVLRGMAKKQQRLQHEQSRNQRQQHKLSTRSPAHANMPDNRQIRVGQVTGRFSVRGERSLGAFDALGGYDAGLLVAVYVICTVVVMGFVGWGVVWGVRRRRRVRRVRRARMEKMGIEGGMKGMKGKGKGKDRVGREGGI